LLNNKEIINEYRSRIDDNQIFPTNYYGSTNFTVDCGTAHLSIIGDNGDAVAITSSINHA
jgi:gamma-glutamyltranspeptidase/glutathione hydrolase/leukotriene-C4 hydrolase